MNSRESAFLPPSANVADTGAEQDGDRSALSAATAERIEAEVRELHERHSQALASFARMITGSMEQGEEALQEAYHRYLLTRSQGTLVDNPLAWMLRVIHNLAVDWKKIEARKAELRADVAAPSEPENDSINTLSEILRKTRGVLSPREQEVLNLRLKGLRYVDVAEVLGIGEGSVSSHLSRAFRKLRRVKGEGKS